jgi:hypothetical protein
LRLGIAAMLALACGLAIRLRELPRDAGRAARGGRLRHRLHRRRCHRRAAAGELPGRPRAPARGQLRRTPRWADQARRWSRAFRDPGYLRVGGRPLFGIHDAGSFLSQWGGIADANRALAALHRAGAFVATGVGDASGLASLVGLRVDALRQYHNPLAIPPLDGPRPWAEFAAGARGLWRNISAGPLPLIPSATSGWDPRPWREYQAGHLFWFQRTPTQVAALLRSAIGVARRERIPGPPLALVASWNELGEGHYILPTIGQRFSYIRAVAAALERGGGSG